MTTPRKTAASQPPDDVDEATAARIAEASDESKGVITWRHLQLTYELDANAWPAALLVALRDNTLLTILELIFGSEAIAEVINTPGATRGDLAGLYREWGAAMGFESPGESPASRG